MKSLVVFTLVCFMQVGFCVGLLKGVEDNPEASGEPTPTSPPKKQTKILFTNNWAETLQGSLSRGEEVRIVYDSDRLPGRDRRYGQRAWEIFAEVKYSENDTVYSPRLEGPDSNGMMTTTLTIPPEAIAFIIWFKHWGYYSGYSYDSNNGKNYRFPFNQIVFTDTWDEYVKGGLYPGEKFQVVYNALRLPWRDTGYLGMGRAWNIFAHAQFSDNGPVVQQMLEGPALDDPTMTTLYDIPENAKKVVMWFYFTGYRSGTHYDSNNNMNYHFALSKNQS